MIVSLSLLEGASKRLQAAREKAATESYQASSQQGDKPGDALAGAEHGVLFFVYLITVSFFILEIMLVFYAVKLAFQNSVPGMNRVAHVSLAFFFTFPYLLFTLFLGKTRTA